MDAPQGRYRVIEKDGRLIVIDNATGQPASTSSVPPPRRSGPGPGLSASPVVQARGGLDALADMLLSLAVKEWDEEGRAVVHWTWQKNGKEQRWDAVLDLGQQRRLGRALLGIAAAPLLVLLFMLASGILLWIGIVLILAPVLWGFRTIAALQAETAGQPPPGA